MTEDGLPPSRFYMWRALTAMAHADGVITPHEVEFLSEQTANLPLSQAQREMLGRDLREEQDVAVMFSQVTDAKDREEFFLLARVLCWSDGDFDEQERKMIELLEDLNMKADTQAMLERSRKVVQEIELNRDQWDETEKPLFEFFGGLFKKAS